MTKPLKAAVLAFPGSNREGDVARALRRAGAERRRWSGTPTSALPAGTDLVVLPGGFSYGDYLRCGAIAARAPVMEAVAAHAERGGLVLGVCNGFQILCEAGLLPGALMRNARLAASSATCSICRSKRNQTPFTRGYDAGR